MTFLAARATDHDVNGFYRLFLARLPENEEVVRAQIGKNGAQLIGDFVRSDEFRHGVLGTWRDPNGQARLAAPADAALRRWAAAFFEFDEEERRRAARTDDSFSLLALVLERPQVGGLVDALLGEGVGTDIALNARAALARDLPGFTTADDLAACYGLFLDRMPEPELTLADRPHDPLATTIAGFVGSIEFTDGVVTPAYEGRFDRSSLIEPQWARWAYTRMGIDEPNVARLLATALRLPCIASRLAAMPLTWCPVKLTDILWNLHGARIERRFSGPTAIEPRLDPSLLAGVPIDRFIADAYLRAAPLASDGGPNGNERAAVDGGSEWLVLAPAGTLVSPHLAAAVHRHAARSPETSLFYADDLAVDTVSAIDQLRLKPAFDRTLLAAQDYVGAPLIIRAQAFARLGGLDPAQHTAAAADLLFRADAAGLGIDRIPEVLIAHSGKRVRAKIEHHRAMVARHIAPSDCYAVTGRAPDSLIVRRRFADPPSVTLVVPTGRTAPRADASPYVERLLEAIGRTDWPMDRLMVLVGDDGEEEPGWARRPRRYDFRRVFTRRGGRFNYAAKMNRLLREVRTEQVVLLNDDVLPLNGNWLQALQTFATMPTVGGVGARLMFEDGSLQHAGMAPSGWGSAHAWLGRRRIEGSYQGWALVQREWSMVTGAVFATRMSLMAAVGGFDERFALEYNDTDLCLRLRARGLRIVYNPDAEMIHAERASRGSTPVSAIDTALYERRWREWLDNDPAWHSGLSLDIFEVRPQHDPVAWYH